MSECKTVVCGSRSVAAYNHVRYAIEQSGFNITELISGGCKGPDRLAERWAKEKNVPIKTFLPDWDAHGKAAGPIRNKEMVQEADAVIAVWDGISKGTKYTIDYAKEKGIPVYVYVPANKSIEA